MSEAFFEGWIDDRRLAHHESGHALIAHYFGAEAGPLSIEPRRRWLGVAMHTELPAAPAEAIARLDVGRPLVELPHEVRDAVDQRLLVLLGGIAGEMMAPQLEPAAGGPIRTGVDVDRLLEEAQPAAAAPLEERELELLATGDNPELEPPASDTETALELAIALVGPGGADPYVRFMLEEARRLLEREELLDRRLSRLAGALLEHRDLSIAAVAATLNPTEEEPCLEATAARSLRAAASSST